MKYTKFILPLLSLAALVSCTSPSTASVSGNTAPSSASNSVPSAVSNPAPSTEPGENRLLILFFDDGAVHEDNGTITAGASTSSGSNGTERIADLMHQYYPASDLIELTLENPYSRDDLNYSRSNSRVVTEYNNGNTTARPALSRDFSLNPSNYTHVIVGYPLWWMHAPWPLLSLFEDKNYDFSGKVFRAYNSNGYGNSTFDDNLEAAVPGSTFLTPVGLRASNTSTIQSFVDELMKA